MATERKRQQIMQAAEKLFASRRFHEITTDDIAREAGVGKGTIYRYFRDKDDLFFETANVGFDELCEILQRHAPSEASFADQLLQAARDISGFFSRRRKMVQLMQMGDSASAAFTGDLRKRWLEKRRRLVLAVAAIIRKGIDEGHIRPDVQPEVLSHLLLGMLRARSRDMGELPEECRSLETVVSVFYGGARAGHAPAAPAKARKNKAALLEGVPHDRA